MNYLNKFLAEIKKNSQIFKSPEMILIFGLTSSHIKSLKKYALESQLITQTKQEFFLTSKGEEYLDENPVQDENINIEYLKEEKIPAVLTKAIRLLAKHLILNEPLKDFTLEQALLCELKSLEKIALKLEKEILNGKRINLENFYDKYLQKGLTKSIISIIMLEILTKNSDKIAIYEKMQFQLNFDCLMFDRMIACPQNFEIQKTVMEDVTILKDVSKIVLNEKNNNILDITKGLYKEIKKLDKYTMNTQNLSQKTLRLRNVIINAKDPMSLFERDIPKVYLQKNLQESDRKFLNDFKLSLNELKSCTGNLIKDLKCFLFESFKVKSKEDLAQRFLKVKDFLNEKELKVLFNNVVEIDLDDDLWINRIATFINKSRVPKDWSDEDYADFKIKTKELSLKFFVIESTVGADESAVSENYHSVLNSFLNLTKPEQMILLRKVVNS